MKPIRPCLIVLAVLACQSPFALASPTDNEFEPCHRLAAMTLQYCLDRKPGYTNDDCWSSARKKKDACYADVRKSHQRDPARIEAERRAAEEAKRRALEEERRRVREEERRRVLEEEKRRAMEKTAQEKVAQ